MTTKAFDDSAPAGSAAHEDSATTAGSEADASSPAGLEPSANAGAKTDAGADTNAGTDTNADAEMNAQSHAVPVPQFRTGIGFDTHAFAEPDSGRKMMMACLEWPGEVGLEGHSDADVAAHTCCDALLAAAGLGDLGTNFGTSRPEWAGAPGEALMRETVRLVNEAGYEIVNVSVQIIGERPRIGKRRSEAEVRMSEILGAPVNLAASTTDKLGFAGRSEGVAGIGSALVVKKN